MKRRWFLSYNSQDLGLVQGFEALLRRKDPDAEIFFAPKSLRAGGYWLPSLADAIAQATAFVLLVGEKGLGPWQVIEYYEALDRRVKNPAYPVALVLLEGQPAPGLPFLRQLHWIVTADPASDQAVGKVLDATAGSATHPDQIWRYTAPYRGLAAMEESDSEFFFGRYRQTVEVLKALEQVPDRLPVLLGNSGVGKSSLAQAGVLASLKREAWPEGGNATGAWPQSLAGSRGWCFLKLQPGTDPLRALVEPFLKTWQFDTTDPLREKRQRDWVASLLSGEASLRGLLSATEDRLQELGQPKPRAFFLYIDQGEELYVRAEQRQRQRFSELLAHGLGDPRLGVLMSLRADFFGALQRDEALYAAHHQINVPPLREGELHNVVSRPARLLSARFETEDLAADIARRTAEESTKDAGALPLLSYLLDDMWTQMVTRGDGVLRLPAQAVELGGVLAERADARHPKAEEQLRRILTLKLATVREDGEPTRRRAWRSEFSDEEWLLVSELADHPHRLLVTIAPEGGETYAEVAHEAIFRRWHKLREWMADEREFLLWKTGLEAERRRWEAAPDASKNDALLMGLALAQAQGWVSKRGEDLPKTDLTFVARSLQREALEREQKERFRRRAQWIGIAALLLVTAFAVASVFGFFHAEAAKERAELATQIAERTQAKYDILKAGISGNEQKLKIERDRNLAEHLRRTASAVVADLRETYELLDNTGLDFLVRVGVDAKRILWFDVAPENNRFEVNAFTKLGFLVHQAPSIAETIEKLRHQNFDLIITHFGFRPGGKEQSNAYRLKAQLEQSGFGGLPIVIYTLGATDEFICDAQKDGFYDETDKPAQLTQIAIRSVRGEPRISRCPS